MDRDDLVGALRGVLTRVSGIRAAYLVGSRARGTARSDSDLDLAIAYEEALSPDDREKARRGLLDELSRSLGSLGEQADIVDLDRAGSAFGFRALREGVRLFVAGERTRVRLEARIMRYYDEDAPRRELFRRAAIRAGGRMGEDRHGRP